MTIIITLLAIAVAVLVQQVVAGAIDYYKHPRPPKD